MKTAKQKKPRPARQTYWVRFHVCECPPCGRDASYRERVYDEPKPTNREERYRHIPDTESYCGCMNR